MPWARSLHSAAWLSEHSIAAYRPHRRRPAPALLLEGTFHDMTRVVEEPRDGLQKLEVVPYTGSSANSLDSGIYSVFWRS
jgi:hypothetical protein